MEFSEQHQQKATLSENIGKAHKLSIYNQRQLLESQICECFHCLAIFPPSEIYEWIDKVKPGKDRTALCPKCGIDSVLGDKSGYDITNSFWRKMRQY